MKKHTKKALMILTALALAAGMIAAGCSAGTDKNDPSGATVIPGGQTGAPATNAPAGEGYVFKHGNVTIRVNDEADPIIAALGEPVSKYESPSCAFEGMDVTYTYSGGDFDVTTYTSNGKNYIMNVVLFTDNVETQEGIYIGSSAADVNAKYGIETAGKTSASAVKGDTKILFLFENDVVKSIQYLSAAD